MENAENINVYAASAMFSSIPLPAFGLAQIDAGKDGAEFGGRNLAPRFDTIVGWHCIGAFFEPFGPDRETVPIPVQYFDPVPPPVGEDEQMSGKGVQLHRLGDQRVQAVEALAHVAGCGAEINAN